MCCSIKHLLMLLALPVFFYAGMCFERSYKMIKEQTVQMKGSWQEKTLRLSAQYTTTNHLNDKNNNGNSVQGKVNAPSNNNNNNGEGKLNVPPGAALPQQQQQQQQQWQQQSKIRLQQQATQPSSAGAVPGKKMQPGTVPPQQQQVQQPNRWQVQTQHPKEQGSVHTQSPKAAGNSVGSTQHQQQQQAAKNNKPGDDLVVPKKVALKRKKKVGVSSEGTTADTNSDKDNNQELSVAQQQYEKRKKSREQARANSNQSREEAMAKAKQIKATAGVSSTAKAGVSSSSGGGGGGVSSGGTNQANNPQQKQQQKQQNTKPPNVIKPVLLSKGNGKKSSGGGQKAQQQQQQQKGSNNNSKNVMDPSEVNLDDFYMCRMDPAPVLGQPRVDMPGLALPLTYQCAGEEYDQFANLLEQLIRNKGARGFTWGKRKRMLPYQPPHANGNNQHRRLLIMGNSHTRQVAITLLCQYRHQVLKTTYLFSTPEYPLSGVIQIDMTNNLTVYVAANCPFVYTQQWNTILEGILKQPLSAMNAIVVGNFNQFQDSKNTFFYKSVMSYQEKYPDLHLDFENQKGPQVEDLVKLYDGPIVHVSMFAENFPAPSVQEQQRQAGNAAHRVKYIDGRKYIDGLKKLQHRIAPQLPLLYEGASNETPKGGVAQVETNVGEYRFSYGHRCVGARGGHVDLIAWDVVTALYKMIPKQGNTGIQATTRVQE